MTKATKATHQANKKIDRPASELKSMTNRQLFGKLRKNGVEVKTERVGSGLTRRTVYRTTLEALLDFDPKTEKLRSAPLSEEALIRGTLLLGEILGKIEYSARKILKESGYPDRDELVTRGQRGKWEWSRRGNASTGVVCRGLDLPLEKTDSVEWYAAAKLRALDELLSTPLKVGRPARSNVLLVVNAAYVLGRLEERSFWKFQHEVAAQKTYRSAKKRKKYGARGAKSNKISADARKSFVLKKSKVLLDAKPHLSPAAVAKAILHTRPVELEIENGARMCAASTVARYIRAFKKRGML